MVRLLTLPLMLALAGCAPSAARSGIAVETPPPPADATHGPVVHAGPQAHATGHVEWGYAGDAGPERWASLGDDYRVCSDGREESPIDLQNPISAQFGPLGFGYGRATLRAVNNGHTIQFDLPAGQTMSVHGRRYELLQMHVHHPSEHLVGGRRFPLEFHLVHKGADGQLGVVGVFGEIAPSSAALEPLFAAMPDSTGKERSLALPFDITALLPSTRAYFTYEGSLTTPPCTENVDWFVLRQPVPVTADQVKRFEALYPDNARPVQRQFRRFVLQSDG